MMFNIFSYLCVLLCRKGVLLFGWVVFLLLAYKVSKLDREYQEYNPYEVLNLDPVNTHKTSSQLQIKWSNDICFLYYEPNGLKLLWLCVCLQGASQSEIKKQYRVLSLKHHPDKGGDEATFMRIAKAHAA